MGVPNALRICLAVSLLAWLVLLNACGGGTLTADSLAGTDAAAGDTQAGAAAPQAGLPALSNLAKPTRQVSLVGPGFLPLGHEAILESGGMTPGAGSAITLTGAGAPAYAVYGVYGFDGDNGPTSVRITSSAASGTYFVGFSDYSHGKWIYAGPFSFSGSGGTTVVTIPNTGSYVTPHAFIADYYSATYVAVIVKKGAQLDLSTIELGVHGGQLGPLPPFSIGGRGSNAGMSVFWGLSPSTTDPDFAGYMIERAEQYTGEYTPLNSEPVLGELMMDPTALMDHTYRYRGCAVDTAGNRSTWVEGLGIRKASLTLLPVAVVTGLPHGPVYGPVTLDLDMSGSYDPEGNPISLYEIYDSSGEKLYSSAGYAVQLTLQPGCHALRFRVTAGAISGQVTRILKVLPRWQNGAYMVIAPQTQPTYPRLPNPTVTRTADGDFLYCAYDAWIPAFSIRRLQAGQPEKLFTMPLEPVPQFMSEPAMLGDDVYWAAMYEWSWELLHFDGTKLNTIEQGSFPAAQTNDRVCLTSNGADRMWAVFGMDDGGMKLYISSLNYLADAEITPVLTGLLDVDATFDPATNTVWVIYSTNTQTLWEKVDADSLLVLDSGVLANFASPNVDAEYDSVNNMPVTAYYSLGNIYYSWNDGIWHLGETVDISGGNSQSFDLACLDGKPRVLLSDIGAQSSIYTRDGANTWSKRDVAYSSTSGLALAFAPYLDADGPAYGVADVGVNRHSFFAILKGNGSESQLEDIWPSTGQGLQMHGAGGADGLHVIFDSMLGPATHVIGNAAGQLWSGSSMPNGAANLDLTALHDGTVYLSYNDGANTAKLDKWDGAAWQSVASTTSQSAYRPFLAHDNPSTIVSWASFDDTTGNWTAWQGNTADGYASATDVFNGLIAYSGTALVESPTALPGFSTSFFVLKGPQVFGYIESALGQFDVLNDDNNTVIFPLRGFDYLYDDYVYGRNLAAAHYVSFYSSPGQAVWLSNGASEPAVRYTPRIDHIGELTELPVASSVAGIDMRRTVSAITAQGGTAVGLVCDLSGKDTYMEWSNFGNWERLPLPGPDANYGSDRHMNQAELFTGLDGRWHIVYRDYLTDTIFIRSTL